MLPKFIIAILENGYDLVKLVVFTLAAIAKSNFVLMGRTIFIKDRRNIKDIVCRAHIIFNRLNIYAFQFIAARALFAAGFYTGSIIVKGNLVINKITVGGANLRFKVLLKRAQQYIKNIVWPNAHFAIYYPAINKEYAIVKNINSLKGKSFYR